MIALRIPKTYQMGDFSVRALKGVSIEIGAGSSSPYGAVGSGKSTFRTSSDAWTSPPRAPTGQPGSGRNGR